MKAEVITLLKCKRTTDFFSTTQYVKDELRLIGTEVYTYSQMNERLVLDTDILNAALSRSDIIIITSPIDTLYDDKIKSFLSDFFSLSLIRDMASMEKLEESFKRNRLDVPQSAESLCFFPKGAKVFQNKRGIQNGYGFVSNGKIIICVPDDDVQQRQMYDDYIFKFISRFSSTFVEERTVGVYGLTGAYVKAQLSLKLKNKKSIISIKEGEDDALIRVVCGSKDEKKTKQMSYNTVKEIADLFSDYVYGIDIKNNMQAAVNEILCKDIEFSFVDAYTRGALPLRLKEAKGFKEAFIGYTVNQSNQPGLIEEGVSPNLIEKYGVISDEVATALAFSNLCFNHSDIAIGIIGSVPKKGKSGKVIVSICDENKCQIHHIEIKDNGLSKNAEDIATDKIINIIRVFAKEYPQFKNSKNLKLFLGDYIRDTYTKKEKIKEKKSKTEQPPKAFQKNIDYKTMYSKEEQIDEINEPIKKESKMKKFFLWFLLTACILCLVGSIAYIIYYYKSSDNTKDYYDTLADLHISVSEEKAVTEEIKTPVGYPSDYEKRFIPLWQKNNDVAGWIKIPTLGGGEPIIDYPVVKREGDKNEYYNRKDFNQKYSRYGVPFVDYECDLKLPSDNIIIYGHNMKDGQMFGCFENYINIDYMKKHPVISYDSVYKPGEYAIFGIFYAATLPQDNPFNYHCFTTADTQEEYNSFVNEVKKRSLYDVAIDVEPTDELITLSTCVYKFQNGKDFEGGRFVLVGRRLRQDETKEQIALQIKKNNNPLMPSPYYKEQSKQPVYPTGVNIDQDSITISENKQQQLGVSVLPKGALTEKLFWHSSDEKVVKVYSGGLIESVGAGNAVVSVSNETGKVFDKVNVSVIPKTENSIQKLNILGDSIVLKRNDVYKIEYEYFPKDAKNVNIVFSSENIDIATVDDDGIITGMVTGRTKIKAFTSDGKYLDEISVKVVPEYIPVDSIDISSPDLTLDIGRQVRLFLLVKPLNATNAEVIWRSDNTDVATVSSKSGRVTAISEGSAKITVETVDGDESDFIYVDVRPKDNLIPVQSVAIVDKIELPVGKTANLYPKLSPANSTNRKVSFKSSNPSIFTISEKGVVTALKEGTATATVTTDDGNHKADTIVTVTRTNEKPESIRFDKNTLQVDVAEKLKLTPLVYPLTAKDYEVVYSSSNTNAVLVDQSGNITARASGKATITAQIKDTNLRATCTVEVTKPVDNTVLSAIHISPTTVNLEKDNTVELSYTLEPQDALNKEIVFTSKDENVAIVDQSGTILAVGGGKTQIVVSAKEGDAKAVCEVTVEEDEVLTLTLSDNDVIMKADEVKKLVSEITPTDSDKEIVWTSSDDEVATVDGGSITAVKAGNVTITAQIKDTEIKAVCRVLVEDTEETQKSDEETNKDSEVNNQ